MVLSSRLEKLKDEVRHQKLDASLISNIANILHLTNYSGFSQDEREAYLLVVPFSKSQYIFTDGRYAQAVKKLIPDFKLIEISSNNKFSELLKKLIDKLKISKLGIEENDLRVSEFKAIKKVVKKLKDFKFGDHRSIKTTEEIKLIEKACKVGDKAFKFILGKIQEQISEKQLSYLLEQFIQTQGFSPSFKTIVAFGKNSSIPHHNSGEKKLKRGDFVLLDFGVKFKNYCSDMTRTLVFGKATQKQKKVYRTVLEAQEKAVKYLNTQNSAEVLAKKVDEVSRNYILEKGFSSIPHSLGHGIGIEVHEHPFLSPNSKEVLKTGMVFSIEPGIYIPGFGGVRIEDLYVKEKNGIRKITTSPENLIEIKY